ncbi:outer membrane protein assembly factor BamB family protein [Caldinitratiruptor microaerophilus]|uniref:LysM domain-containing protein n=1 Tax=Caldinitratiruptor microaerophilus TaxID=671077 RepID=A0AA35CNQ7_9FIRM|nr:PQQ-binding-like beta-propeller repeat protein [Caldinitratiruptor microaerophilus]BDG61813.1 hypothetical protein caldi_29030 [Caldinitratiruptor microaerophilus]
MVFVFVQRGETLYSIARRYRTTVHAIVAANGIEDPNAVAPGQALIIPGPAEVPVPPPGGITHLVRPGETVFHLARRFGSTPAEIVRANHLAHPEFILPGQQLVIPERPGAGDEWPFWGRTPDRRSAGAGPSPARAAPAWEAGPRVPGRVRPSPPVVRYGRVYAGLGDGAYACWDLATGRARWRLDLDPAPGTALAAPAVFDGLVYLAAPDGLVLAVDAFRGGIVWRTRAGDGPAQAPAVAEGLLLVAAGQVLWALEVKTGARVWRHEAKEGIALAPAATEAGVYAVLGDEVVALAPQTGEVLWRHAAAPHVPPACAGDLLLIGGQARRAADGVLRWSVAEPAPPAVAGEVAVYPGGAVDLRTGEYRWQVAGPHGDDSAPPDPLPVAVAGTLALGAGPGPCLVARSLAGGAPVWEHPLPAPPAAQPAVVPGFVALTLADGRLVTLKLERESACARATGASAG